MPPPVNYTVEWRCPETYLNKPLSEEHRNFIEETAASTVKYWAKIKQSTTIRIRSGVHSETKNTTTDRYGNVETTMIKDKGGAHYTAEYEDPDTNKWTTFHYYVIVREGGASLNTNNSPQSDPNPRVYGKQGRSYSEQRRRGRTVTISGDEI